MSAQKQEKFGLKVGETITLQWNGFEGVPKWLSREKAVILGFGNSRVTVQPEHAISQYRVRPDQIWEFNQAQLEK